MGISVNGPSGIDTQSLIDQLVALEQQKVTKIEEQKKAYQLKIDSFSELKSLLSDFGTKASELSEKKSFDLFTSTSSDEKAVTISGGTGSVDASYAVRVFQVASEEKMISKNGIINSQTENLGDLLGSDVFNGENNTAKIKINDTEITINASDTIQDLRAKINSTKDATGNSLGVSASVVKVNDSNFRLVLTSTDTGSNGVDYKDEEGSLLQELGIITSPDGNKGNTQQKLEASGVSLGKDKRMQLDLIDHNGEEITKTFTLKGDDSAGWKKQIEDAFNGMVDVNIDGDKLEITDKVAGTSQLAINSLTVNDTAAAITTEVYGTEGDGVLSVGKDAYFSVEGITMTSDTNTASDFMTGVTFNLHSVSVQKDVKVSLERDVSAIKEKVQALLDSYNALAKFSNNSTKVRDPNDENSSAGALSGDSTVKSLVSNLRSFFQKNSILGETYTNFALIGFKTDSKTGMYSLEDEKFEEAIDKNLDEVMNLFTKVGVSDDSNITFGKDTSSTQEGIYQLKVENGKLLISSDETNWTESDTPNGEIFTFSSGAAKGLSLTIAGGNLDVIGSGSANFTFSKGLGSLIDETIDKLTDTTDGLIALRQESWKKSISNTEDRIERMEKRVESYRERLVQQYSNMEIVMSTLSNQTTNMINSLSKSKSSS